MAEPIHPEVKYKRSKKIEQVGLLKADLSNKLDEVSKDAIKDARTFGVAKLDPYNGNISTMEKDLQFLRYYSTFPRNPSTTDVVELKEEIQRDHKIYRTRSQQLAAAAAYNGGRKIKERYTPSPVFDYGNSRRDSAPSLSEVSITESSFMREPSPQPVPAALPAPPRFHGSMLSGTVGSHGMYGAQPIASSSSYTPSARNPTIERGRIGHRYINSFGQPQNFLNIADDMSEKSAVVSEENEQYPL
ncbi:hypothetical protein BJ912DRAFT_955862 [Pholiota molesta]|nr:hypothetical protein BJ912DRAFT_955862 [Pholiota molesta]